MRRPLSLSIALLAAALAYNGSRAYAQDAERDDPSLHRQRAAAANAYDRGSEAFLAGDYADAARWFELANRFMPSAPALRQAARAHIQADNIARAATVAQRLHDDYGDDEANIAIADEILAKHAPSLTRVVVECEDCSLLVDGTQIDWHDFYLVPDVEHTVVAEFDTGEREQTISGTAGQRLELQFEAPPAPPGHEAPEAGVSSDSPATGPREGQGLPPALVYVGTGLTVLAGGALIWSVLEMNKEADAYEDALRDARASRDPADVDRAEELLREGDGKELRTEVLIGATATLAATTIVLAIFTDWSEENDKLSAVTLAPSIALDADGAQLSLSGRF